MTINRPAYDVLASLCAPRDEGNCTRATPTAKITNESHFFNPNCMFKKMVEKKAVVKSLSWDVT